MLDHNCHQNAVPIAAIQEGNVLYCSHCDKLALAKTGDFKIPSSLPLSDLSALVLESMRGSPLHTYFQVPSQYRGQKLLLPPLDINIDGTIVGLGWWRMHGTFKPVEPTSVYDTRLAIDDCIELDVPQFAHYAAVHAFFEDPDRDITPRLVLYYDRLKVFGRAQHHFGAGASEISWINKMCKVFERTSPEGFHRIAPGPLED
ncbi:MAG: hypothetical protein AABY13_04805 [Nanoarchaeota archaeon]